MIDFEKYMIPAEEGFFSKLKANREAQKNEKLLDNNAHEWFEREYGSKVCSIISKYSSAIYNEIAKVAKQTEKNLGVPSLFKIYKETPELSYVRPAFITPTHDYSVDVINVDYNKSVLYEKLDEDDDFGSSAESEFDKNVNKERLNNLSDKIEKEFNKLIPFTIKVKLIDDQPDICYNVSVEITISDLIEKYKTQNLD